MKRALTFEIALLGAAAFGLFLAFAPAAIAQLPQQQAEPQPQESAPPQQQANLVGPTQFDGTYAVETDTSDGTCGTAHWTVAVNHGQIASISPNDKNITASGLIEDDGVVSMTFRGGDGHIAHVGGAVKAGIGKGAWSSPTLLCGGTWRAAKEK
jgi:hypothetical protein